MLSPSNLHLEGNQLILALSLMPFIYYLFFDLVMHLLTRKSEVRTNKSTTKTWALGSIICSRRGRCDICINSSKGCCLYCVDNVLVTLPIIRFPPIDDFKLLKESMAYKDMRASKFDPAEERYLELHFIAKPVGNM
ncbi:uncharacterized protein LOC119280858 [Triticum dicoccoides]|uniref:uncharacterized protein LOC119280858 n=1 Tax=Triticum dicoccoides TaxID=85692 RepID=UPI00188E7864|nr:uncharacterized protein LOC119280858 [Triticum dicoccoides]